MRNRPLAAYAFLLPALGLLATFTVLPLLVGSLLSLFQYNVISPPKFVGFENFKGILHDPVARLALRNSALYLLVVPVIQLLSIGLALLVNREMRGIRFFRALFYVPVITSIVVVAVAWKWVLADDGLLNGFLVWLHFVKKPVHWLTDPSIALFSVMLVTLWKGLGYYMVIYLAGLQAIDPQYEEAARLDGAGPLAIFRHVTFPLLKPTAAFCTMISCIAALKVFAEVYVMTEGGPLGSTTTMVFYMFDHFVNRFNMGYAASLGLVLGMVIGGMSTVNYRFFRKGGFEAY